MKLIAQNLPQWQATKETLHLFYQVVGKIKLALNPRRNHWWHIPFYLRPQGLSTGTMVHDGLLFELLINLKQHELQLITGEELHSLVHFQEGLSVQEFYHQVLNKLEEDHQIAVKISNPHPFDCHSTIPFSKDEAHQHYDAAQVETYFNNLSTAHYFLSLMQGTLKGKVSPVHAFWHSFDIATTLFSGKPGPDVSQANAVTRDAYSDEVVSFGWWPGDDAHPQAAFYAYAYPAPPNLEQTGIQPAAARWRTKNGSPLAVLTNDDLLHLSNGKLEKTMLQFFGSVLHQSLAESDWDTTNLYYPHSPLAQLPNK